MRPHPRIRTMVKWGGVFIAAALAMLWLLTGFWTVAYSTPEWGIGSTPGCLTLARSFGPPGLASPGWIWHPARAEGAWKWTWGSVQGVSRTLVWVPLWLPVLASLLVSGVALWMEELEGWRARLHRCPRCAYDRTGLPVNARCPECGTPAAGAAAAPSKGV